MAKKEQESSKINHIIWSPTMRQSLHIISLSLLICSRVGIVHQSFLEKHEVQSLQRKKWSWKSKSRSVKASTHSLPNLPCFCSWDKTTHGTNGIYNISLSPDKAVAGFFPKDCHLFCVFTLSCYLPALLLSMPAHPSPWKFFLHLNSVPVQWMCCSGLQSLICHLVAARPLENHIHIQGFSFSLYKMRTRLIPSPPSLTANYNKLKAVSKW